jgi:hypothetical protein
MELLDDLWIGDRVFLLDERWCRSRCWGYVRGYQIASAYFYLEASTTYRASIGTGTTEAATPNAGD